VALTFILTLSPGCGNRFLDKEIKPLFKKKSAVIVTAGNQRSVIEALQENRQKIQALKKEQALLLDANRRLFNQLEFVRTKAAAAYAAKASAATQEARPQIPLPPKGKKYSEFDLNEMGVEAFSDGNYDLSLTYFNNSTAVNPEFYEAFTNMGVVSMTLGQYRQAAVYFKKALTINPGFKIAKNYLRQAEASLKKQEEKKEAGP